MVFFNLLCACMWLGRAPTPSPRLHPGHRTGRTTRPTIDDSWPTRPREVTTILKNTRILSFRPWKNQGGHMITHFSAPVATATAFAAWLKHSELFKLLSHYMYRACTQHPRQRVYGLLSLLFQKPRWLTFQCAYSVDICEWGLIVLFSL